ncbi:hypothetical protein BB561_007044, partial [Smittium simulii]
MTLSNIVSFIDEAAKNGFTLNIPDGRFKSDIHPQLLYQAGLDSDATPILVFFECHLPDPKQISFDELVTLLKQKLDSFVKNDYVFVYFANSDSQKPSLPWLVNTYHDLDRNYKKNLKKLYLVHPSNWTKVLLNMFGTIISP